ncbi:hypothetical protein [Pseudomonas sp. RIT-To-2]|uniref:hypothetical protein n=1 Tax=Pseudomonas sp. RIT-To-2 TaxID=3462541 RepID=UPI0024138398
MKARKIVQLHTSAAATAVLVALCDDGSVWQRSVDAPEAPWARLPGIPADTEADTATPKPANTGQRWDAEHDEYVVDLWVHEKKLCAEIAQLMQRTEGAILARLAHLHVFPDRDAAREADKARRAER